MRFCPEDKALQYVERRKARAGPSERIRVASFAAKVLRGELYLDEIDPETTDWVRLQDDVAQGIRTGRERAAWAGRSGDHSHSGKIWTRELRALELGQPLTPWTYDLTRLSISRGEHWEDVYKNQVVAAT